MDPMTLLLAKFIGPVILAVGAGIFFSKNYYTKVYRNLENETLAVLMSGIITLVAGITIVLNHNVWDSFTACIVTFVGWASILKGFFLIVVPNTVDRIGDMVAEANLFPFMATLAIACGGYVSYIAYLA